MTRDALPCISCKRYLDNVIDEVENQPYNGTSFITNGHYGSTVFDPMDGTQLEINVCDDCLRTWGKKGNVLWRQASFGVYCQEHTPGLQVGIYYTDRPSVTWDPEVKDRT